MIRGRGIVPWREDDLELSMSRKGLIACRHLLEPCDKDIEELATVMSSGGEEHRKLEHIAWIRDFYESIDHNRNAVFVARLGETIVGFIRIWHSSHIDEWLVEGVTVLPAHQREGIASNLLRVGIDFAAQMNADSIIAHTSKKNTASIRLHEKAGFSRETDSFRTSYGQWREGTGWRYRLPLPG